MAGLARKVYEVQPDEPLTGVTKRLVQAEKNIKNEKYELAVTGVFNAGKSTLLNALLGKAVVEVDLGMLNGEIGPLPTDFIPTTALPTRILFGREVKIVAWKKRINGQPPQHEIWTMEQFFKKATISQEEEGEYNDKDEVEQYLDLVENGVLKDIQLFDLQYPASLCEAGINLIDTAGTRESEDREADTKEVISNCDAGIHVIAIQTVGDQSDLSFLDEMYIGQKKRFIVINLIEKRRSDISTRHMGHYWNKLVNRGEQKNPLIPDSRLKILQCTIFILWMR